MSLVTSTPTTHSVGDDVRRLKSISFCFKPQEPPKTKSESRHLASYNQLHSYPNAFTNGSNFSKCGSRYFW